MPPKNVTFFVVMAISIVIDQVTKFAVYLNLELYRDEITVIPGFFSIVHAQNPGAAFSMLANFEYRHLVFLAFTLVAIVVIGQMQRALSPADTLRGAAFGLILGGAVGNAIDRVHKRTVTDFLRFYVDDDTVAPMLREWIGMSEWPSFNVADATLFIGVAILLVWGAESPDALSDEASNPGDAGAQPS